MINFHLHFDIVTDIIISREYDLSEDDNADIQHVTEQKDSNDDDKWDDLALELFLNETFETS